MRLSTLDIVVLALYFVAMIAIGIYVTRRASKNLDSYFLGDKAMPWWLLGVSNASAMWDITGTMWLVTIVLVYGVKAIFLPWLWPVFNQVFDAVYLSKWIRRSGVRTGAEWITTRFGDGRGGEMARAVVVVFALISVIAFISYDFQGMGKFCKVFLDPVVRDMLGFELSPHAYAVGIMAVTAIYVVLGGMLSVVLTDFVQFILMAISSVVIGVVAVQRVTPEMIDQVTPAGWRDVFSFNLALDWSGILPSMNGKIAEDGMATMFGLFFTLMVFKGILVSMAGSAPNYDMQRILAAKNPREASLMSAIVSLALVPRWILIAAITLIGLVFVVPEFRAAGGKPDFELVLPYVINNFLPVGLTGILLAGLLSAFMSTFSATVNAGAAYLVNDLYKRYIDPDASDRKLIRTSYVASIVILIAGMSVGYFLSSINQITQWIVNGLFGGYMAANVLKWYWWRFNGHGYFWGMVAGIGSALAQRFVAPDMQSLYYFPIILVVSATASLVAALVTQPVEEETLKTFYRNVRPWGFWGPIHALVAKEDPTVQPNTGAARDLASCAVGIVWQLTLVTIPLYLIFRDLQGTLISLAILVATTVFLKKFWYDHIEPDGYPVDTIAGTRLTPKPVEQAGD